MVYGPPVQPLNYSALGTADDVQVELAKVVEDFAQWLGVVESGLSGVLEAVAHSGAAFGKGDESGDLDSFVIDESYEFEDLEVEENGAQDVLPAR